MDDVRGQTEARRRFLRMLMASPLFAGSHFLRSSLTNLMATNVAAEEKAKGLAWLMRRIRSRMFEATSGLPGRRRDFLVQCHAKALRCQRRTVSG
jgi:hypothetical protein